MFSRHPRCRMRRLAASAGIALLVATTAACANTDTWVDAGPAPGWPAEYADAANSSYTPTPGAKNLEFGWSRSVKGSLFASVAAGSPSYVAVNGQTPGGCSLMVWEYDNNGRQRWCTRLFQGGGFAGPLIDQFDNVYVGEPGSMLSFPPTQWVRWRQPVIGMPQTPRFLGGGNLLVVTHLGQVQVLNAHRGTVVGRPLDLVLGIDPRDPQRGLDDCQAARAGCPVAAAPAFSGAAGRVVVALWQPGTPAPGLVGLRYQPTAAVPLTKDWETDAVTSGVIGAPVFAADGRTVYVNSRDGKLWAIDAENGEPKWSVPLGFTATTPPSVSPDGLIVSGGGPDAWLLAVRDNGERGEVVWQRDDVKALSTSSQTGSDVGYTVVRDGPDGLALVVFNPADGKTVASYPMPDADGVPVGTSVAHDGTVLTATSAGQVYAFNPK